MTQSYQTSPDKPAYAVPMERLIPVDPYLANTEAIPPSRMFLINKALKVYKERFPDQPVFDASQGDGGASLPGVSKEILMRASELQIVHGTAYDMPYGTDAYRKSVIEQYWQLDSGSDFGPGNVIGTAGGRDALVKAYQAMQALGHGRQGDLIVVSRVPWISYNWGPYGVGANVLWAPGRPEQGWAYTEESLQDCVDFAAQTGRKVAGVIITSPDNPTGLTLTPERQVSLAKAALAAGAAFVLFDWMYHYVTDEQPMNLNSFLTLFDRQEIKRLMFLDGITKSLGGSNVRNCHLIASDEVVKFTVARASHAVMPSFFSLAVAMAAYEMGYENASRPIVEPTNASRVALRNYLDQAGYRYIMGKGYYAFIHVSDWLAQRGWGDSEPLGQYLAEQYGVAVVPGAYFSPFGGDWIRFSYATPVERTLGAAQRLTEGLESLNQAK